jgi:hypothetical protein
LPLDGITLAVCGANSDADRKLVDGIYRDYGAEGFLEAFARVKGVEVQDALDRRAAAAD